jgi:Na+-driven multidrug efflux pump
MMIAEIHMGVGLNTPSMVITAIHSWGFELVPIWFLTQVLAYNQNAIWWSITLAGFFSTIIFYVYYQRGRWLTIKV